MNLSISLLASCVVFAAALFAIDRPLPSSSSPVAVAPAPPFTGEGDYRYESTAGWGPMPGKEPVPTHGGVARDKAGNVYVSTNARGIVVFNPDGTFKKDIAREYNAIHSLTLREEVGTEYLYAAWLGGSQAIKLKTDGTVVLKIPCPMESGKYEPAKLWKPTAVDAAPDGSIFVADGYYLSYIHKFDAAGKYLLTFGGKGKDDNTFETCHGMVVDRREEKATLLICDREGRRLQQFDLDGKFVATIAKDLRRPAAVAVGNGHIAVAELEARVTIFDRKNKLVAHLGDNPDRNQWANFDIDPPQWDPLIFTAPHGVCWDNKGGIFVQDWNRNGRVRHLKPVK